MSIFICIYSSIYLLIRPSNHPLLTYVSICISTVYLAFHPSVLASILSSVLLCIHISIHPINHFSIHLFVPGVQLFDLYQPQYIDKEKQRQELTNAEKLFDLPITMFPSMTEVDKELKNTEKVFEIYKDQKVSQLNTNTYTCKCNVKYM